MQQATDLIRGTGEKDYFIIFITLICFYNGPFPAFIFVFSIQLTVKNVLYVSLPMTGFEPRTSGMQATALPTEALPLPNTDMFALAFFQSTHFVL